MASVLAAVLDDLRAIIAGSSTASPIASGRYVAVEYDPATLLPVTASRPYPFEVEVGSRGVPTDYPTDVSGTYAYYSREIKIRIGYSDEPHEGEDRQDEIVTDEDEIVLALERVASWSASGWVAIRVTSSSIVEAPIAGSDVQGDLEVMKMLEITCDLVYRETRP